MLDCLSQRTLGSSSALTGRGNNSTCYIGMLFSELSCHSVFPTMGSFLRHSVLIYRLLCAGASALGFFHPCLDFIINKVVWDMGPLRPRSGVHFPNEPFYL